MRRRKRSPFRPQVTVEEGQSGVPGEARLAAVAEVEDVAGAWDYEEFDRPPKLGEALRQAAGLLNVSRVVAAAMHKKYGSLNRLRLTQRRGPPQQRLQLGVAPCATGATEADTDQAKNESPREWGTGRLHPVLEIGYRIVGDDRSGAAVVCGDEQTEHTPLREAEEPDAPRVHVGMGAHTIDDPPRIGRIPPRNKVLAPASARSAQVVGGDCHIACTSQVVQHAPHFCRLVSRLRMDDYRRQRPGARRPHPLQPNFQVASYCDLGTALRARRRPPRVHEVVVHAPGEEERREQHAGAETQNARMFLD
jgi:hypothetical protein